MLCYYTMCSYIAVQERENKMGLFDISFQYFHICFSVHLETIRNSTFYQHGSFFHLELQTSGKTRVSSFFPGVSEVSRAENGAPYKSGSWILWHKPRFIISADYPQKVSLIFWKLLNAIFCICTAHYMLQTANWRGHQGVGWRGFFRAVNEISRNFHTLSRVSVRPEPLYIQ